MDADECQSGLNLASQGALAKLAVRQFGRLIGIYMLPTSDQLFIMRKVAAGMDFLPIIFA